MSQEIADLNAKLLSQMRETMQVRYYAAKRLNFLDRSLTLVNAIASGYLIWVSIWALGRPLCPPASTLATLVSSGLAILLLCISLLVYASRFGELARDFHQSGLTLSKLYHEFRATVSVTTIEHHLAMLAAYDKHLREYPLMHAEMDHRHYRFTNGLYKSRGRFFFVQNWCRIQLAAYYPLVVLFIVTVVVASTVIGVEFLTNWTTCAPITTQQAIYQNGNP